MRDEDEITQFSDDLNKYLYRRETKFPLATYEEGVLEALCWAEDDENDYDNLAELRDIVKTWKKRKKKIVAKWNRR